MDDQENLNSPDPADFFAKIDAGAPVATEPTVGAEVAPQETPAIDFSPDQPGVDSLESAGGPSEMVPTEIPSTEIPIETSGGGKKKFLLIIFLIILLVIGGLVVKRFLPSPKSREVTLTYWGLWETEAVMNEVIADYQKDHPKVKINYFQQAGGKDKNYRNRLKAALAKSDGPDIFRLHNSWVPMFKENLAPVPSSFMDKGTFKKTFYESAVKSLESEGNYFGVPLAIDGLALFYNEDIFEARTDVQPPKIWDDVLKVAKKLQVEDKNGRILTAGVALGTTQNVDHWSDILALLLLQNDVSLFDLKKDFKGNPTDLGGQILNYYARCSYELGLWDESLPNSTQYFAAGKLAMYFGPSWRVFDIKALNPKLRFKVVPVPQVPGNIINWASYWAEGVSKKSPNQAEAWEFLKYLSSREGLEKLFQATVRSGRLFGEPYPRVDMANLLKDTDHVAPFIEQAPTSQGGFLSSNTFDEGINDETITYFGNAINGLNKGEISPESATETVNAGIKQVLLKFKVN